MKKIRGPFGRARRVLGLARTRVRPSHGPENRREKVPKRVISREGRGERAGTPSDGVDDKGGGKGEAGEEAQQKGAPSLSEATVRTRRGIASHTGPSAGTGPDGDRNSVRGPRGAGARRRPGPCSRQRQRQARASHATRTRPSRPSREHKPRFFHPRRYLPLPSSLLLLRRLLLRLHPPLLPPLLAAVPAPVLLLSCFRLFFSWLRCYRDGSRSRWLRTSVFFFIMISLLCKNFAIFYCTILRKM